MNFGQPRGTWRLKSINRFFLDKISSYVYSVKKVMRLDFFNAFSEEKTDKGRHWILPCPWTTCVKRFQETVQRVWQKDRWMSTTAMPYWRERESMSIPKNPTKQTNKTHQHHHPQPLAMLIYSSSSLPNKFICKIRIIKEVCFTEMATPSCTPEVTTSFCITKILERTNFPIYSDLIKNVYVETKIFFHRVLLQT